MQANFNNITAAGITYKSPESPPCHLHWKDPNGFTNFWCPVTSGVSGSSSSPRTEYRETEATTSTAFNWFPSDFPSNRMEGTARVLKVPSSEKVVFAQVHAKDAPTPFVKLFQNGQELRAEVRFRPSDAGSPTVIRMPFDGTAVYSIEVTEDSRLIIVLNDQRFECPVDEDWNQYPFYFKAGAYVIDNGGDEAEGGWVVYENLSIFHG